MKLNGWFYAPSFIPEQGLQLDYKYLLIRESQKEARALFGRIKTDLMAVLFLWDENNSGLFTFESRPEPVILPDEIQQPQFEVDAVTECVSHSV